MNNSTHTINRDLHITSPAWLADMQPAYDSHYPDLDARMGLVIQLAASNIEHGSGGPFAAAIFDMDSHRLISVGVNVVVAAHCSLAHAEMMAIALAQQRIKSFDLASGGQCLELVSSCEPCAMCFGAIPWSGVQHIICGARDADARAIGFDEGPKLDNWQHALEQRGIAVTTDICRQDAVDILQRYAASGGNIYNGGDNT